MIRRFVIALAAVAALFSLSISPASATVTDHGTYQDIGCGTGTTWRVEWYAHVDSVTGNKALFQYRIYRLTGSATLVQANWEELNFSGSYNISYAAGTTNTGYVPWFAAWTGYVPSPVELRTNVYCKSGVNYGWGPNAYVVW